MKFKKIIFILFGIIFTIGSIAMITEDISGAIFFGIIAILLYYVGFRNLFSRENLELQKLKREEIKVKMEQNNLDAKIKIQNIKEEHQKKMESLNKKIEERKEKEESSYSELISNAKINAENYIREKKKWQNIINGKLLVNQEDKILKIYNKIYDFSSIIDCELIEDGNSITKSSLLGTAAKGLTFGLAGYLSASKKEKKYCNKLEVKITINDFKNPCAYFKFITKKTKKDSKEFEKAFNNAQNCLSIIKIVIENK